MYGNTLFSMNNGTKPVLGYVLKGYPRISETFISNEILRLEQLGFHIKIFPMRHPRENFCHESVKSIQAPIFYLPTHLFRNLLSLAIPNIALAVKTPRRYAKALLFALKRFHRSRKTATFKHLLQAGFLVNNYLREKDSVDHLHGHFAHSPTSVTMFASKLSGVPFSFTAHAKDIYTSKKEQLREKIELAEFVATCTQYNGDYLRSIAGETPTPIYCIYHGIDTSLFSSTGARKECRQPYSLLTVARLTEKKGLPTLYSALHKLKKKGVDFRHTLIGDGDDRKKIIDLINELELQNQCQWLGTQTHEEVLDHFRRSDLFILGCQIARSGDRDGIPNVLVESLAMGVPAVSTSVSAIPELIQDGNTGLLVPPGDSDSMADAIIKLLQDQALRRHIIPMGQKHVQHSFDNEKLTVKLADVFVAHAKVSGSRNFAVQRN